MRAIKSNLRRHTSSISGILFMLYLEFYLCLGIKLNWCNIFGGK
jgi:hypothetical protein